MMITKICTTIEQSKQLMELGANENTADMHWQYIEEDNGQMQWFCLPKDFSINQKESIPAWSISALSEITKICNNCEPTLRADKKYNMFLVIKNKFAYRSFVDGKPEGFDSMLDAMYEAVRQLLKNKLLPVNK